MRSWVFLSFLYLQRLMNIWNPANPSREKADDGASDREDAEPSIGYPVKPCGDPLHTPIMADPPWFWVNTYIIPFILTPDIQDIVARAGRAYDLLVGDRPPDCEYLAGFGG